VLLLALETISVLSGCTAEEHDVQFDGGRTTVRVGVPRLPNIVQCPVPDDPPALKEEMCNAIDVALGCPSACGAFSSLEKAKKPLRSSVKHTWHPASDKRMAILQSLVEHLTLEGGGAREDVPHHVHEACLSASHALQAGADLPTAETIVGRRLDLKVGERLGYPLTVVLSYLVGRPLMQRVLRVAGWDVGPQGTFNVSYGVLSGLVPLVNKYGWTAAEPRQYYDSHVAMMGEHSIPLMDGGWVNSFLQSAEVYGMHLGKHYYHKVPWTTAGYDFNFSVYEMPDDRPVRIGVLADWSTGTPAAHHILKLFSEQKPDVVVHLGDTYYSGTPREQMDFMVNPMRAQFPPQGNSSASTSVPFYAIPGNHDYFSGGLGFYHAIHTLGYQEASYFCLRNSRWQILALDTGLVDNNVLGSLMPVLSDDQLAWALFQLDEGERRGLKTILMSHHQFFSRSESVGKATDALGQALSVPDRKFFSTYEADGWKTRPEDLPGHLPRGDQPAVNTRLLAQISAGRRQGVSAFYWGHEHSSAIFDEFVNITRGRLVGNSAIAANIDYDTYQNLNLTTSPWGSEVPLMPKEKGGCAREGCRVGQGNAFWNLGFVTIDLDGGGATAKYWEVESNLVLGEGGSDTVSFSDASVFFEETF